MLNCKILNREWLEEMSTSILYHCFGLTKQEYLKTEYIGNQVIIYSQTKQEEHRCARCNSYNVRTRGGRRRDFKTLPIGRKQVIVRAWIQRLECLECGAIIQEQVRFADPKRTYTNSLKRYVLDLSSMMTILDVARTVGLSWDIVKAIQKEALKKKYDKPDIKGLKTIAIDEIAIQKGHKYLTIVADLESGAVVYVGDGKGADSLEEFWKRVKRAGCKIEAVSIDMSPAYIESVERNLGRDAIVFDHFHIVKLLNDSVSAIRREIYNNETNENKKKL
jgi:transposase